MNNSMLKELIEIVKSSEQFDEEWYTTTYPDVLMSELNPAEHFVRIGSRLGREPNASFNTLSYVHSHPEVDWSCTIPFVHSLAPRLITNNPTTDGVDDDTTDGEINPKYAAPPENPSMPFDTSYYALCNPDVAAEGCHIEHHFNVQGFTELRNPRADFDLWWYTQNYLLGTEDANVNPLNHYNITGVGAGYLPRPKTPITFDKNKSNRLPASARRICLFAGYDRDGLVDDYVVEYITELSKYADVYYLADCEMHSSELKKLDGIVQGAWAQRHGKYDFGSWSLLAKDLVGWSKIEQYDELLFVNDSCYLVRPLGEMFDAMSGKKCAWWGLQATKGFISTMSQNKIPDGEFLSISEIKNRYLDIFENDRIYDFHIGSYFTGFRKSVFNNEKFRVAISSVDAESSKLRIIRKYEVGITRFLIGNGFDFETYVDTVSKQHPIFSERIFDLIENGFPLLKRYLLTENHYKIPGLARWKGVLRKANPSLDVDMLEDNLLRVGNAEKLHKNFRIGMNPNLLKKPLTHSEMEKKDKETPKFDHWWAFPVCAYSHQFSDNIRAVFEQVKDDPQIKKIVLTRSVNVKLDGDNIEIAPLNSYEGQSLLLRSRHIFLRHGVKTNIGYPLSSQLHQFHNLWHGIPLKRIGYTSLDEKKNRPAVVEDNEKMTSVIASSDVDRLAMAAAYYPLSFDDVWVTGLPRHDTIMMPENRLADDMKEKLGQLERQLGGRRFLLFAPTLRADQENGYYKFSDDEVAALSEWLEKNGFCMGIREHMADQARLYSSQLKGESFFNASERQYPDIELLYRKADILLTDYSSCFIDFMLTGRPMASFAYDRFAYENQQRGLFYDQDMVFPGPICSNFTELMSSLDSLIIPMSQSEKEAYNWKVRFFHKYQDAKNARRVINRVKESSDGSKLLWDTNTTAARGPEKRITFVYSKGHDITNRYRIYNIVDVLRDYGWICRLVTETALAPKHLMDADVLVVCRIQMSEKLSEYCETFRENGGKIVFDIDDIVHDVEVFSESEYFCKRPEYSSDSMVLVNNTLKMVKAADLVTTTTRALANNLVKFNTNVEVIPNCIPAGLVHKYGKCSNKQHDDTALRVCYLSGTATHSMDFSECWTALRQVLKSHSNVEFHLVGKMKVDGDDDFDSDLKIHEHDVMPYEAMHEFLRTMDINLAPLARTAFNDAKSELKIFEAALHGVPTIASPTDSYSAAIVHGKTGMLAANDKEWEAALTRLIVDPTYRKKIGNAAAKDIAPRFFAKRSGNLLAGAISKLLFEDSAKFSVSTVENKEH